MSIRIFLVDDHELFRSGLRAVLGARPDLEVVGEATSAREACAAIERLDPDVAVIDVSLAGTSGIALVRELRRRHVRASLLILTMHTSLDVVADSLAAGADGYASKDDSADMLAEAVRTVERGARYLSPRLSPAVRAAIEEGGQGRSRTLFELSAREREVFDLLVRGFSNQQIGKELCISVKTVETHRTRIFRKMNVHSLADLVRLAARNELLLCDGDSPPQSGGALLAR